jgi:hypothetical protein
MYSKTLRLNKRQLDALATVFGTVTGISAVLVSSGYLDQKLGGAIGGIFTVLLGVISNRPASASPDTAETEDQERHR